MTEEVIVYTLDPSKSFRKVRDFLQDNEVDFKIQRITKQSLSWEQLMEMLMYTTDGVYDVLSTKSKDYKLLTDQGVDFDELTLTELQQLIKKYPRLLSWPITVGKSSTLTGYNEEEIRTLMNRSKKKDLYNELKK